METKMTFKWVNRKWRVIVETKGEERQRAILEDRCLRKVASMAVDEMEMQQDMILFMKWLKENKEDKSI